MMLQDLRIPRMGSVENARLVEWRVGEGASYAKGEILYEVETDKTTVEVEADEAGVLVRQLAETGDEFKVGDRIGTWAPAGTTPAALAGALAARTARSDVTEPFPLAPNPVTGGLVPTILRTAVPREAAGGRRISPLARRLAAQHDVDLSDVIGTGAGGKISGRDVLAAHDARLQPGGATTPANHSPPLQAFEQPRLPESGVHPDSAPSQGAAVVPHSMRRRTIAQRMVQAGAIPSLTADMEVDLSSLMALRASSKGQGASVLGLIAHAAVAALLEHSQLNSHWRDDAMVCFEGVHLGIAVDTPDGLVVPVVRNAERLSALGLTHAAGELAERARAGRLRPEELDGGTFTISNPGSIGPVVRAEALLNPPQVALLGLPGIVRTPVAVRDGAGWAMAVRPMIRLSLTFDHRALDGGPVIRFLNALKFRIESL